MSFGVSRMIDIFKMIHVLSYSCGKILVIEILFRMNNISPYSCGMIQVIEDLFRMICVSSRSSGMIPVLSDLTNTIWASLSSISLDPNDARYLDKHPHFIVFIWNNTSSLNEDYICVIVPRTQMILVIHDLYRMILVL